MRKRVILLSSILILTLGTSCGGKADTFAPESSEQGESYGEQSMQMQEEESVAEEAVLQEEQRWEQLLLGGWQANDSVGAGYAARFWFDGDGTYAYAANQMTGADRLRFSAGDWWITEEILYLSADRLLMLEGGEEVEGWGSMENDIEGGQYVLYELSEEERVAEAYPLDFYKPDDGEYGRPGIWMGDTRLWAYPVQDMDDLLEFKAGEDIWSDWNDSED